MPIDPSIPLQVQSLKLESPINQLGMMNEALKYGEMSRGIEEQNKLNEYLKSGADLSSAEGRRGLVNYGKTGLGYAKALNEQDLSAATLKKTTAEAGLKTFELDKNKIDKAITDIANHPDANSAYADIQKRVQAGELPVDKANFIVQQLKSMPYEKFQMTQVKNLLGAKDRLTLEEQAKHNRTTEGISAGHLAVAQKGLQQGTIPAGYRMSPDGKTLEAIPGGPTTTPLAPKEVQAREAKYPMATQAVKTVEAKSDKLIADIETLKNHPGLDSITGTVYGRTPSVTAEGRQAQALYDSIVARGGFQELAAMRAASPTGGALGNVSNQEGQQLKDAFGTLNRTQDASSLRTQLGRVADDVRGAKQRVREAYDMTYDYKAGAPASGGDSGGGKADPLGIR
jgi:hypothetical protein